MLMTDDHLRSTTVLAIEHCSGGGQSMSGRVVGLAQMGKKDGFQSFPEQTIKQFGRGRI